MKIVDLTYRIKETESFKFPNKIVTLQKFMKKIESDNFWGTLYGTYWEPFGSDIEGGIAYFGKSSDVDKLEEKVRNYLESLQEKDTDEQYYARWDIDSGYSILNLYQNNQGNGKFAFPKHKNVLKIDFGKWCNDDHLSEVLEQMEYWKNSSPLEAWFVNNDIFDDKNKEHMTLLEEFKKSLKLICFEN